MSITEHTETYKIHGFVIKATANFIVNKIKLEIIEPVKETVYVSLDKYTDFDGNMEEFVGSCLNSNHKSYKV